jgi:hypothetical protein
VALHFHPFEGAAFWAGEENADCPALLEATSAVFAGSAR